jgi:hypothetical protein|tara:strand:+ start:580 stop:876 length:297 start_codon:yes stop_codon:yes gene_type:complete
MYKVSSFLVENNLLNDLKRYKSKLAYSFMIGLIIGSLPFVYKVTERFSVQKLIQEQRQKQIENKEKICKGDNSDYKKFLSLGFPKTAIEKFNKCMQEQ